MVLRAIASLVSVGVLLSFGSGARAQAPATEQPKTTPAPSYVLKASSKWAKQIDDALAKVAQRVHFVVPSRFTPQAFVQSLCAGAVNPEKIEIAESNLLPGRKEVRMPPCVQVRRNVKVAVSAGDTLDGLAVVSGLPVYYLWVRKHARPGSSSAR